MNRRVSHQLKVEAEQKQSRTVFVKKLPSIFRTEKPEASQTPAIKNIAKGTNTHKGIGTIHLLFICLSLAIAATGVIYHLHIRFEGVRLGYEASEQRKIQTRLMLQRRELRLELASMKELGRIEDEAREKLGMESPRAEEFVHVNKTKKVVSVSGGAL